MIASAVMSLSSKAPRRGRPPKFGRPTQLVTVTLPQDVVAWLSTIDADLAWAIVKLHERMTKGRPGKPVEVADLVQLPGERALILVRPDLFNNLKGVSIIPLSDGRGFLALEAGRGVSDLELAVIDRLDAPSLRIEERDALSQLRELIKQWRQDGVHFESRSIIVAHKRRAIEKVQALASFRPKPRPAAS